MSVHCLCDLDLYNPQFVIIGARDQDRGNLVTNGVVSAQGGRFADVGYGEQEIYKHGDTSV